MLTPTHRPSQASLPSDHTAEFMPLEFILDRHNTALGVLMHGPRPAPSGLVNAGAAKAQAKLVLQMYGYSWPTVLDEEYPELAASEQGVRYTMD